MPTNIWNHKLQLGDVFHNEALTIEQKRNEIVHRIKVSNFYDEENDGELWEIVDELSGVQDVDEFDAVWDRFYDWADYARVWVETFKAVAPAGSGLSGGTPR
jgi:hypothetical protein